MEVWFVGNRSALFWLALKTGFWTVLTLGFYRFWMKTRLRRWYWSAIRPGGHPLEYVGDPLEKLLGFFIAVVILTFYIGIVNLLLMFVSFSFFQNSFVGYFSQRYWCDSSLVLCAISCAALCAGAHALARGAVWFGKRCVGVCLACFGALADYDLYCWPVVAPYDVLA